MPILQNKKALFWIAVGAFVLMTQGLNAQSLDIPSRRWGVSFGNSKEFTGLRFNFRDSQVRRVTGINITLWTPRKDNTEAVVSGLSLGLIPGGAQMKGIHIGLLGAGAGQYDRRQPRSARCRSWREPHRDQYRWSGRGGR